MPAVPAEFRQGIGCPNQLGWDGNAFSTDPQYGHYPESAGEVSPVKPSGAAHGMRVFIAVLGDAGFSVKKPSGFCLPAAAFSVLRLAECELEYCGRGLTRQIVRRAARSYDLRFLVLAPSARSTLKAATRGGTADDAAKAFDRLIRGILEHLVRDLGDFKVLEVTPWSSTWSARVRWQARRRRGTRSPLSASTAVFCKDGGSPRQKVAVRTRFWTSSMPSSTVCAPSPSSGQGRRPWRVLVSDLVLALIDEELHSVARTASDRILETTTLTSTGRVSRHACRGPPVWDPRAHKRAEDLACQAGLRDPAALVSSWPDLWKVMSAVGKAIHEVRDANDTFRGLTACLGAAPTRRPPDEEQVRQLRSVVAGALGLSAEAADDRSAFCPWRHGLVAKVQALTGDPDTEISAWMRDGAPMGIAKEIRRGGGIFPDLASPRSSTPEAVLRRPPRRNHPSFEDLQGLGEPPGHSIVQKHLDDGFGFLFSDKAAAESFLQSRVAPAPLGCITKRREDGSFKYRVILDLKANGVNTASSTPERQVLPTVFHHALDLAVLGASDMATETLILDFKDAFMSIGLEPTERPFNACAVSRDLFRRRPRLHQHEPDVGKFVVWRVLGFGGKPNPLIFARVVSFASRTAQALLRPAPDALGCPRAAAGRLQTYVDDPVLTVAGDDAAREAAFDLVICWWLALGVPLAWKKGAVASGTHRWIGADFVYAPTSPNPAKHTEPADDSVVQMSEIAPPTAAGCCVVRAPPAFLAELSDMLAKFASGRGHLSEPEVDSVLGKLGRLAYLVPAAKPFVSAMWGARAGCVRAASAPRLEAPPGRFAARRFAPAARWLQTLIDPPVDAAEPALLQIEHYVSPVASVITLEGPCVQVDASPWGAGAVLCIGGVPKEHACCTWSTATAKRVGFELGSCTGQTFWEYLAVLLVLEVWGTEHRASGLAVLGDNLASLNGLIALRGKSELHRVTCELAWRKVRFGWRYAAGHLPAEANVLADALSRLEAPPPNDKAFPASLRETTRRAFPDPENLWVVS